MVRIEPKFGEAYWTLANFKSFHFSTKDLVAMRNALRVTLSDTDKVEIHFALGKAYEDRGDYQQSFRHYFTANAIRASDIDPAQVVVSTLVNKSIDTFTGDYFATRSNVGCPEQAPIFVVGLHRSGSTLIEQILASHPLVEGANELNVMKNIRDRLTRSSGTVSVAAITALKPADFRQIGQGYLERTQAVPTN